jgi:WavE lipopolysaccharide synthesis.
VSDREISVIVQGPVVGSPAGPQAGHITRECLASVRRHWPGAELVLSTWRGSDLSDLGFDVLVESEDPGSLPYDVAQGVPNNVNRQLVTTKAGLAASSRRYVLKIRSDMQMQHDGLLRYFDAFPARSDWSFVGKKVIGSTTFARIPGLIWHLPYHPGDLFFFGEREDMRRIWDIPLASERDVSMGVPKLPHGVNIHGMLNMVRCAPEQYIWLSFLRKYVDVLPASHWDRTAESIAGTEKSFASNLILVSPEQAGLVSLKFQRPASIVEWAVKYGSCYTHTIWKQLYFKYCLDRPRTVYAVGWGRAYLAKSIYIARRMVGPGSLRAKVSRGVRNV